MSPTPIDRPHAGILLFAMVMAFAIGVGAGNGLAEQKVNEARIAMGNAADALRKLQTSDAKLSATSADLSLACQGLSDAATKLQRACVP